jgi:hypothetical protein
VTIPLCHSARTIDRVTLPARAVLWNETDPVLPVLRDLDCATAAPSEHVCLARSYRLDGAYTLRDDPGVDRIECDSKSPDATAVARDTPVTEIHPEEISICRRIERREVMSHAFT